MVIKMIKLVSVFCLAVLLLIGCGEQNLDNPKAREKIIAEATDVNMLLRQRESSGERVYYAFSPRKPYTGWVKDMEGYDKLFQLQNGKPHGLYISWYRDGQNYRKATFRNGKKNGLFTEWYRDGQKESEATYKDDKEHGLFMQWYPNGSKKSKATYKDGLQYGSHTEWYENGQKKREQTYKNGKKDGVWTEWSSDGAVKSKGIYKDGILEK